MGSPFRSLTESGWPFPFLAYLAGILSKAAQKDEDMRKRKLQVFISSTYTDLVDDRFAAIEAILAAGHIPAAMEQFSPGDETAWEKIRRWIDESDCFILILGGRYGSLEPTSGKSYVQLEYEYALDKKKPYSSLIITEAAFKKRVKSRGLDVDERKNQEQYKQFKDQLNVQHCGSWDDWKDIRSHILQKILTDWSQRDDLIGWVRGDEAANATVTNELARLSNENNELREKLAARKESFGGLEFDELVDQLCQDKLDFTNLLAVNSELEQILSACGVKHPYNTYNKTTYLSQIFKHTGYIFDIFMDYLSSYDIPACQVWPMGDQKDVVKKYPVNHPTSYLMSRLVAWGLVARTIPEGVYSFSISDPGRIFRNHLHLIGDRDTRTRLLWSPEVQGQSALPHPSKPPRKTKGRTYPKRTAT